MLRRCTALTTWFLQLPFDYADDDYDDGDYWGDDNLSIEEKLKFLPSRSLVVFYYEWFSRLVVYNGVVSIDRVMRGCCQLGRCQSC